MKYLKDVKNWEELKNEVVCGDCLEGMKLIPDKSIDLVLTDPPYGIGLAEGFSGAGGFSAPIARRKYDGDWDKTTPSQEVFMHMIRISKTMIVFGGNYFTEKLPQANHWLVWDKLNTMPTFSDCELIWTNVNRKSVKKYTHNNNGLMAEQKESRVHPTQKPTDLIKRIIEDYSKPGDLICDPFMGSWTTARACKDLGYDFIGFELSKDYCKIGEERLRQEVLF